jgi:hypothetical protein
VGAVGDDVPGSGKEDAPSANPGEVWHDEWLHCRTYLGSRST